MSVAVIGDQTFVTGFELIGAKGFRVREAEEARKVLAELIASERYRLIILPERFTAATAEIRMQVLREGRVWPVFAIVPDLTKIKGKRLDELKSNISFAIGAKLYEE
ncbi:TPA: hypothetical protein EYP37_08820 [Candidatus Poribacteria bacterium]|nr:hypothetical protein [Candidatus Poribacteria bacterium]